ncbi:hypothetical protein [Limnoglobus roseus]|uniref:Uncharacterized protein n=1 Tax=Limnoglobus roseus TaxID=2598579 RepID=A0A5C1AU03_9BACT|nr:hypothetical protein [Limnoglobus roseus]QEL21082.1 hypothetical protein PX52LOC_08211 [Limnoglobus roseus]
MPDFKIDLKNAPIPTKDGDVNEYINSEAAALKEYFSRSKKVIFVNGMGNTGQDHAESAMALSLVQLCPVIGVFNQSSGLVKDLLQCLADKNQFQGPVSSTAQSKVESGNSLWNRILKGYRTPEQVMMSALSRNPVQVSLFNELRKPENRRREIFAHSQGNLILSNVLQAIGAVDGPQALAGRTVHTFGSPAVFYPPGVQKFEHGFTFDPVNWLSGFDRSFSISKVGVPTGAKNPITHGFLWYLQDDPRFVINRFRTGGWGATFNMDEDGLAKCLAAMETNLPRVRKVIDFLDKYQNSDADDVSVLYVQAIQQKPAVRTALKADKELVKLLIKTMDEGYTSGEERDAINWLKAL